MESVLGEFRAYLRTLIDDEFRRRATDLREMLDSMQRSPTLPDWYRIPAQQAADVILEQLVSDFPADSFSDVLQEAIKAVYGAWIREQFRNV